MGNKHDAGIFKRFAVGLALCLSALALTRPAAADVPLPPPPPPASQTISGSPNGFPLTQTVNGPHGRVTVEIPRGAMDNRFSSIGRTDANLNGFRNMPSQFTDGYGNVARGNVRSVTQLPPAGKIARLGGPLIVTQIATSHLARLQAEGVSDMYSRGFEEGNWGQVANATAKLFDWTGVGSTVNGMLNSGEQQALGDVANILQQQAMEQARQQFERHRPVPTDNPYAYTIITINQDHPSNAHRTKETFVVPFIGVPNGFDGYYHINQKGQSFTERLGNYSFNYSFPAGNIFVSFAFKTPTKQELVDYNSKAAPQLSEITPSEAAIISALEQLLNNQQRNNTDLINALQKLGAFPPGSGKTTVSGTAAENTFLTAPFTPLGSNTAQQTQFVVNPDGSVTVSTVQRPDLAANTSQAPTRQQVGQTAGSSGHLNTQPAKEGSTAAKPDVCAQNPGSLMCADMGSGDYTDPVLPTQTRGLDFNPSSIFGDSGVCPAPKVVTVLKTQVALSYEPTCDIASKLRPIVVLLGMAAAMWMVWGTVNE